MADVPLIEKRALKAGLAYETRTTLPDMILSRKFLSKFTLRWELDPFYWLIAVKWPFSTNQNTQIPS